MRKLQSLENGSVEITHVFYYIRRIHVNCNFTDFYLLELRHEFNSQLASHMHFYLDTLTANLRFTWQPLRMSSRQPVHYITYINKPDYPTYITNEYIIQNNQNKSHIMYSKKDHTLTTSWRFFFFFFAKQLSNHEYLSEEQRKWLMKKVYAN